MCVCVLASLAERMVCVGGGGQISIQEIRLHFLGGGVRVKFIAMATLTYLHLHPHTQGEWSDCRWPKSLSSIECSLVIITSPRTYFMYAECSEEAEEWRRVLQTAHDLLRENAFKGIKITTFRTS